MLSSLAGAAITAVKIKGVNHEFQAIEGVKEDALEIILNIKGLRLKCFQEEPVLLRLKTSGKKEVTAEDIEANADVEIINGDHKIATLTDTKSEIDMELVVSRGRGYSPTEERRTESQVIGMIAIDALFSPVRNVGYRVENTRVGEITNYDRLVMAIETDGTITAEEAVRQSAKILMDHFMLLMPHADSILHRTEQENFTTEEDR